LRCGASGANCSPIAGATTASYTVQNADVGSTLRVTVTASNAAGSASVNSAATQTVIAGGASCTGFAVGPATDLQAAVNSNPTGTTFCLQPGTYYPTSAVLTRSYDSFIGQPGVVLDGQGKVDKALWSYGGSSGQTNVSVQGIIFQHFTGSTLALGWYAYVGHNEMRDNQIGITINSYSTVDSNYIHDNYQYGINGGPATSLLIENNEIAHNNTSNFCGGTCLQSAGGSKIVGSTAGTYGLTWQSNNVHDNIGHGIWSDGNVHNALYANNTVSNNSYDGIFNETSWDAVIRNNTLTNNDSADAGLSCWHGSQISLNDSSNVEVSSNTVNGSNGANGICAIYADKTDGPPFSQAVVNLYVHDNTVQVTGSASNGLVASSDQVGAATSSNNRFVHNAYTISDLAAPYWEWPGGPGYIQLSWAGWQSQGQDLTGSISQG
jgi:parallel beta-helix repeat protein